jgi:hypothetical protein
LTLRELLKDQGIDPNALLRQPVGAAWQDGGGVKAVLADGTLDIHIIAPITNPKGTTE